MASEVDICNRALGKLGAARIVDLADASNEARACAEAYPLTRDMELRANPWQFSLVRAKLGPLTEVPAFGFDRQFQLPDDYLALVEVASLLIWWSVDAFTEDYSIEGGRILCDLENPLPIRYVAKIVNPGLFDPLFVDVLACHLAMEMCDTLTGSVSRKQDLQKDHAIATARAMRSDSIERAPRLMPEASWITGRP